MHAASICGKELKRYSASPTGWALLVGSGLLFALGIAVHDPGFLVGPVAALSGFTPAAAFRFYPRLTLLIAMTRVIAEFLIPMIAMRLFVEERRRQTIEMLFTSPVGEHEIVLGKWAGAMLLYLTIVGLSMAGTAVFRSAEVDAPLLLDSYGTLAAQGAALLAAGEYMSTLTRHEAVAAIGALLISMPVLRVQGTGTPGWQGFAFCAVLAMAGWFLTWRSLRALRWAY